MLAYMFRFDAKKGYFMYPEVERSADLKLSLNRGLHYDSNVAPRDDVSVIKHGLLIPKNVLNYAEFVAKIKDNELEFQQAFNA